MRDINVWQRFVTKTGGGQYGEDVLNAAQGLQVRKSRRNSYKVPILRSDDD